MKLLSRWAGNTREPGVDAVRSCATLCSTSRSASGAHATVVGQKPVTPNFGRRAAIVGNDIAAVECVEPLEPMHVHVDKTRQHDVPAEIDDSAPPHLSHRVAPDAPRRTRRTR